MRTTYLTPHYQPTSKDTVVSLTLRPQARFDFHEALHLTLKDLGSNLTGFSGTSEIAYRAFDLQEPQNRCRIAFSEELFEEGNMTQILSWIVEGLFNSSAAQEVVIEDLHLSASLQASFPGPSADLQQLRQEFSIAERPLSCALLKAGLDMSPKKTLQSAYHLWTGGIDLVLESPQFSSTNHNDFQERVTFLSKERESCSKRLKKHKGYIPHITANTVHETLRRLKTALDAGLDMVALSCSPANLVMLQSLREACQQQAFIVVMPSGEEMWLKGPYRLSAKVAALIYRLCGADLLLIKPHLQDDHKALLHHLSDPFLEQAESQKSCTPLCSDQHLPGLFHELIKGYGYDSIICGHDSIFRHPDGLQAGAEAFQYALESVNQGIDLERAAEHSAALKKAQPFWDRERQLHVSSS